MIPGSLGVYAHARFLSVFALSAHAFFWFSERFCSSSHDLSCTRSSHSSHSSRCLVFVHYSKISHIFVFSHMFLGSLSAHWALTCFLGSRSVFAHPLKSSHSLAHLTHLTHFAVWTLCIIRGFRTFSFFRTCFLGSLSVFAHPLMSSHLPAHLTHLTHFAA